MVSLDKACFICGEKKFTSSSQHYLKCGHCGHEIIKGDENQSFVINDILSEANIKRLDFLEHFKQNVLGQCWVSSNFLLDIGSGGGKFLYHSKRLFKKIVGIEVEERCIDFAKKRLGLDIRKDIYSVDSTISVATFWHSLEHMPCKSIDGALNVIRERSNFDTNIIISLPNNESLQYAIFGENFAHYDPPNHIHQFSIMSLDKLLEKYGFIKQRTFYSFSYASFGYLQSILNCFNLIHNYLYYRKKRGWAFNKSDWGIFMRDIYNYALAIMFAGPALAFCIYDLVFPEKGGVITACYKKKR